MEQQEFDKLIKKNGAKNLGWRTERLKHSQSDIENALSSDWSKECEPRKGYSFGYGILQDLFMFQDHTNMLRSPEPRLLITRKDRLIVATVIQWLGTNVGFSWLQNALNKAGYDIVKRKN